MKDENAHQLLAKVMNWSEDDHVTDRVEVVQLLAEYKYDRYQRFSPGKRFVESLAVWLEQFDPADRRTAFDFVSDKLVYISESEFSHLVQTAYPDVIVQERIRLVAEEIGIPPHLVGRVTASARFDELRLKSLYLGLSDGARTNELRRASNGEISNEQIWQAYELGQDKADEMLDELRKSLNLSNTRTEITNEDICKAYDAGRSGGDQLVDQLRSNMRHVPYQGEQTNDQVWQALQAGRDLAILTLDKLRKTLSGPEAPSTEHRFNLIWLLDDFSGSGNTYIRQDRRTNTYKGKIKKIFSHLHRAGLVDPSHYEVFLLLYVATRQAIDHIEYWSERFTSEMGFKPLQLRVLHVLEPEVAVTTDPGADIVTLLKRERYYDERASDEHIRVGGTKDARFGFASCALPIVLAHNTPNNSVYILWGPESNTFFGLFPRVSRHREF